MRLPLLLSIMIIITGSISYSRVIGINTNDIDVYSYAEQEFSDFEKKALHDSYSNEILRLNKYLEITKNNNADIKYQKILVSKLKHKEYLQSIMGKYRMGIPLFSNDQELTILKKDKQLMNEMVKEEMSNKNFYERLLFQIDNEDLKEIFKRIRDNSEAGFMILNGTIQ